MCLSLNYLLSVGAYAYHADRTLAKLLKPCDILAANLGKLLKFSASRKILVKAGEFLVNRLAALKSLKCGGEVLYYRAVGLFICYAYFQCIKSCKGIELVDNERGKSVYSYCMANDNGIEPACSSGSACDGAELAALIADIIACFIIKLGGDIVFSIDAVISLISSGS